MKNACVLATAALLLLKSTEGFAPAIQAQGRVGSKLCMSAAATEQGAASEAAGTGNVPVTRQHFFQSTMVSVAALSTAVAGGLPSFADDEEDYDEEEEAVQGQRRRVKFVEGQFTSVPASKSSEGGLLESYLDVNRGFRLMRPSQSNMFDGAGTGEYDVKFVDVVNAVEAVVVSSTPVKSDTKLMDLGALREVGVKLAKGAEVKGARQRATEGVEFYDYQFDSDKIVELRSVCIQRGKLWQLRITCPRKQWSRREKAFRSVQASFVPKA